MSTRRHLVGRLVFAIVAIYLVISITFGVVVMTPDTNLRGMLGTAAFAGASEAELQEMRETYLDARGRNTPLLERYVDWLVDISLFRWGISPSQGEPVTSVVTGALAKTLAYIVPGVAAATVGGVAIGLRAAQNRGANIDRYARIATYVLLGLPSFWLAAVLLTTYAPVSTPGRAELGLVEQVVWTALVPGGILAAGLLAGQVSLTRSRSLGHVAAPYVRTLHAKGLSERAVSWRILRNVIVPVLAQTAAELFSALVLAVVVIEFVFGIQGLGWLLYVATAENDIPLILGSTLVVVAVGVGGSLIADVASMWLDPRSRQH